jgi:hypothetical protein
LVLQDFDRENTVAFENVKFLCKALKIESHFQYNPKKNTQHKLINIKDPTLGA